MILIGTKCRLEQTVTDALTAANVGSGALPVFGTPYMSALMENAAMTCLQSFLEEGHTVTSYSGNSSLAILEAE